MTDTIAISGWLRKRPRISGHWSLRFVQLTSTGTLIIHSRDTSTALPPPPTSQAVALHSLAIPKNIKVEDVYDRMVRVKRSGIGSDKVFVIRAKFKDETLFTLGAPTREEAVKWKFQIELASGSASAPEDVFEVPDEEEDGVQVKARNRHSSLMPDSWKSDLGMNWTIIDELDGMVIEKCRCQESIPEYSWQM
ncbi:hypothetical protein BASA81_012584 [Batrachochytrium salamandrivorans]|nr:hypothetical protein BASA81_012584 [Batrachochytrium salamandrivorans]